jgi:hypothetical protein
VIRRRCWCAGGAQRRLAELKAAAFGEGSRCERQAQCERRHETDGVLLRLAKEDFVALLGLMHRLSGRR